LGHASSNHCQMIHHENPDFICKELDDITAKGLWRPYIVTCLVVTEELGKHTSDSSVTISRDTRSIIMSAVTCASFWVSEKQASGVGLLDLDRSEEGPPRQKTQNAAGFHKKPIQGAASAELFPVSVILRKWIQYQSESTSHSSHNPLLVCDNINTIIDFLDNIWYLIRGQGPGIGWAKISRLLPEGKTFLNKEQDDGSCPKVNNCRWHQWPSLSCAALWVQLAWHSFLFFHANTVLSFNLQLPTF
jgi:hypothetical protein